MEQSPSWEANRSSASQEFSRILWNPKAQYHTYKSPVPILNQLNPVHAPSLLFEDILILSSHLHQSLPCDSFPQVSLKKFHSYGCTVGMLAATKKWPRHLECQS
jgi:hypothetical protein